MAIFFADECFSGALVRAMQGAGYDVVLSSDTARSADDEDVLAMAVREGRILLTEDNDFGDLTVRLGLPTLGVIRVALKPLDKPAQAQRLLGARASLGDRVDGALVTIEVARTRVRKLT
jgi:predicted nuclease of predicted toxin-antitoxin system